MSTKTTFKRIALVAVAALGFGLLSVVPSSAAVARTATGTGTGTLAPTVSGAMGTIVLSSPLLFGGSDTINVTGITGPATATLSITNIGGATITGGGTIAMAVAARTLTATTADSTTGVVTGSATRPGTYVVTFAGGATITLTVTGQGNSIAPLVGDGLNLTSAATATNGATVNGVAGPANTVTVGVVSGNGVSVAGGNTLGTSGARTLVTVSGAGATISSGTGIATLAVGATSASTNVSDQTFASTPGQIVIATPTAGTITVSAYLETSSGSGIFAATADKVITVTVAAAAGGSTFSASTSTAFLGLGTVNTGADVAVVVVKSAATQVANIAMTLKNTLGTAYAGVDVTATATGPGLIKFGNGLTGVGTSKVAATSTNTDSLWIAGDGSAGVSTVTISVGTTVLATKTVTFYGASTALTAVNAANYIAATVSQVSTVTVKDVSGNLVANDLLTAVSSNTAVATVTALVANSTAAGLSTWTIAGVAVGTATITYKNAAGTATATTVINVTGATATTVSLAFDKVSYSPGEKMTLTLTLKDSTGAPIADQTTGTVFATGGIMSNVALQGAVLTDLTATTVAGVKTFVVYAPLVAGPLTVSATTAAAGAIIATAGAALAVTATATVVPSAATDAANEVAQAAADAAAEATDAANAATDAANAAAEAADAATAAAQDAADAVAALSVQVSEQIAVLKAQNDSLRKQLIALTNLIIKIQKKVRA